MYILINSAVYDNRGIVILEKAITKENNKKIMKKSLKNKQTGYSL